MRGRKKSVPRREISCKEWSLWFDSWTRWASHSNYFDFSIWHTRGLELVVALHWGWCYKDATLRKCSPRSLFIHSFPRNENWDRVRAIFSILLLHKEGQRVSEECYDLQRLLPQTGRTKKTSNKGSKLCKAFLRRFTIHIDRGWRRVRWEHRSSYWWMHHLFPSWQPNCQGNFCQYHTAHYLEGLSQRKTPLRAKVLSFHRLLIRKISTG